VTSKVPKGPPCVFSGKKKKIEFHIFIASGNKKRAVKTHQTLEKEVYRHYIAVIKEKGTKKAQNFVIGLKNYQIIHY